MNTQHPRLGWLLAASLLTSTALAAASDSSIAVGPASAPAGTGARIKSALRTSVQHHLNEAHLNDALGSYTVSPSLIQLRRYAEPGSDKLVCIVGLALSGERGVIADVRGNVATRGTSQLEAVDAAAAAAVARLPGVLAQLRERETLTPVAAR